MLAILYQYVALIVVLTTVIPFLFGKVQLIIVDILMQMIIGFMEVEEVL